MELTASTHLNDQGITTMKRTLTPILLLSLLVLSLATGCPEENNANNAGNNSENNENNENNDSSDATPDSTTQDETKDEGAGEEDETQDEVQDEEADEDIPVASGWSKRSLACRSGIPYIALHFDDVNGYMGCGEAAAGAGLFVTTDKGQSWSTTRKFSGARVVDVRRGPDGKLYGAGKGTDGFRAWEIDDADLEPNKLQFVGVFRPETTSAFKKIERAQNVVRTEDGQMLVDSSLNRATAYRASDADEWNELEYVGEKDTSVFLTRVKALNNKFYGVGSTIATPVEVHLPSKTEPSPIFTTIRPLNNRTGELQELHVWSETKMIVTGVNNSNNEPLILIGEGDLYDTDNWKQVEVFDSGIEYKANIRGMAVKGDTVVVVGGKVPTAKGGFILKSEDAGETWTDITPTDQGKVNRLWNVWMWDNGDLFVAGEQEAWFFKND